MRRHAVIALLALPLAGCRLPADEWGVVDAVWNDFPWWSVIWRLTFWTLVGAVIGLFIGIFLTRRLRKWGAYRLPWPRVRFWLQVVIFILNIIAMPILFGAIGFFEGLYRAGDVALRWSVVGKKWLPKVGAIGADAVCYADVWVDKHEADWEEIQQERRPVNIARLMDRLDKIDDDSVSAKITAKAREQLLEDFAEWKDGMLVESTDWALKQFIRYLLNPKLQSKLGDYGVPDVWTEMKKEATKDGDDFLTHDELTAYLTEQVMIPLIVYPLKKWASGNQWVSLGIITAWFATPPVLMFITRWIVFWWKRRKARRVCLDKL